MHITDFSVSVLPSSVDCQRTAAAPGSGCGSAASAFLRSSGCRFATTRHSRGFAGSADGGGRATRIRVGFSSLGAASAVPSATPFVASAGVVRGPPAGGDCLHRRLQPRPRRPEPKRRRRRQRRCWPLASLPGLCPRRRCRQLLCCPPPSILAGAALPLVAAARPPAGCGSGCSAAGELTRCSPCWGRPLAVLGG